MDLKSLLFSFRGRINRARYWWVAFIYIIAWAILVGVMTFFAAFHDSPDTSMVTPAIFGIGAILGLIGTWSSFAVVAKRLHDLDMSAWWILPYVFGPAIISSIASETSGIIFGILTIANLAICVWFIVQLGFIRGTAGPNRFGPDPVDAYSFGNSTSA